MLIGSKKSDSDNLVQAEGGTGMKSTVSWNVSNPDLEHNMIVTHCRLSDLTTKFDASCNSLEI